MMNSLTYKKILLIIIVLIFIIGLFFTHKYNVIDKLNITKNNVIFYNQRNLAVDSLNVIFYDIGGEPQPLIVMGKLVKSTMTNWYGKDYILFQYGEYSEKQNFNAYKFDSWRKVDYYITVVNEDNHTVIKWSLLCDGFASNEGEILLK